MNMNKYQRIAIACGIVIVFLMLLFPPLHFSSPGGVKSHIGYSFIFAIPVNTGVAINGRLLLIQWTGVLIMTGLGYLVLSGKERQELSDPAE
ncbi:MAG TPA: hypothetical protein PLI53_05335 [Geobacteraceae bacterium]|nr:hypothetical protein [Geobacteraceae bacterium]